MTKKSFQRNEPKHSKSDGKDTSQAPWTTNRVTGELPRCTVVNLLNAKTAQVNSLH